MRIETVRSLKKSRLQKNLRPNKTSEAEITVEITLPTQRIAETVYAAVLPETRHFSGFRSRTTVRRRGRVVVLAIKARDVVALRAAANSFLRFISVASKAVDVVAPFYTAGRSGVTSKAEGAAF